MNETKWTPGPWEADGCKDGGHRYYQIDGVSARARFPYTVCDTLNRHHCVDPEEDRANAHLIAAAPDLYAALEVALPVLESLDVAREPGDAEIPMLWQIRAALAKARGNLQPNTATSPERSSTADEDLPIDKS